MHTYEIKIIETSSRTVNIDANSLTEAMDIANYLYKREEIVLDNSDHMYTDIDYVCESNESDNPELRTFIINKLNESIAIFTVEDLAKLSFGSVANAIIEFEKLNK